MKLYVGTYTRKESDGIYLCNMDPFSGEIKLTGVTKGVTNPSFLEVDPSRHFLYSVGETDVFKGKAVGSVHAFSIDHATGELDLVNERSSLGKNPCHLSLASHGQHVLVANYWGGNIAVFPIRSDGGLGPASDVIQHKGSSINLQRQQEPHPHGITIDATGHYAFIPDLGLDRIMIYKLDAEQGELTQGEQGWVEVEPGAGPRHFVFHPGGGTAYVINELNSTITTFAYDPSRGFLNKLQTISTLPDSFDGENYPADIRVAFSGNYVYGSNRGHDSIVVFAVSDKLGTLTPIQHQSTGGEWPRNFVIDPTGQYLLVANQRSNRIVVFAINSESGTLATTGHTIDIPSPVCLQFAQPHPQSRLKTTERAQ